MFDFNIHTKTNKTDVLLKILNLNGWKLRKKKNNNMNCFTSRYIKRECARTD